MRRLIVLVCGALLVVACGGASGAPSESALAEDVPVATSGRAALAAAAGEPHVLWFWGAH